MSIAKVIEVIAEGNTMEAAIKNAVKEAGKSVRHIRSVYVEGIQALVGDEEVTKFRLNCKVTFVVSN